MTLEDIIALVNFDGVFKIFFAITSAFFSYETLMILYIVTIIGGILFTYENVVVKHYHRYIKTTGNGMMDLTLIAPTPVSSEGERVVVTPKTVEPYLKENQQVALEQANPYLPEPDRYIKFITLVQVIITAPFSLLYIPLIHWGIRNRFKKISMQTPEGVSIKQAVIQEESAEGVKKKSKLKSKSTEPHSTLDTMVQLYYTSTKVTAVLKWVWTTLLIIITTIAVIILAFFGVLMLIPHLGGLIG